MHAISRFLGILAMQSIAPPTHDDVLVVDGGAIVAANAYVAYKKIFSLSSLLALNFESTSSQDLRPTRLTLLIRQKQRKRNFILPVPSSWTKFNSTIKSKISRKKNYDI